MSVRSGASQGRPSSNIDRRQPDDSPNQLEGAVRPATEIQSISPPGKATFKAVARSQLCGCCWVVAVVVHLVLCTSPDQGHLCPRPCERATIGCIYFRESPEKHGWMRVKILADQKKKSARLATRQRTRHRHTVLLVYDGKLCVVLTSRTRLRRPRTCPSSIARSRRCTVASYQTERRHIHVHGSL